MSPPIPEAYFQTVFVLDGAPLPLPPAFAIVTAFNPMDEVLPLEANTIADGQLKASLLTKRLSPFLAIGQSPDGSHSEPGWAFQASLESALEIARAFHQRAFWWIENDQLYLIGCENSKPIPVARFSDRLLP